MSDSRVQSENPHIHVLPGNKEGDDIVIGDVHGNLAAFKVWLDSIPMGSRGFCVGDLVDRGKDSPGVIAAIIEHNKKHAKDQTKGKIYGIRGNHEEMTLKAIDALEKGITTHDGELHLLNGGQWLVDLFDSEIDSDKITADEDYNVIYAADSQFKMIKDYMSSLPYILHVTGDKPFTLAHADMPLNDNTLQFYISRNLQLTDEQIEYVLWARKKPASEQEHTGDTYMEDVGRKPYSIPVLVGHNIVSHAIDNAVRKDTNTIDLDFGSWYTGSILSLNVTRGTCEWSGTRTSVSDGEYKRQKGLIETQLSRQSLLQPFLRELRIRGPLNNLDELMKIVGKYVTKRYSEATLLSVAITYHCLDDDFIRRAIIGRDANSLLDAGLDPSYTFKDGSTLLEYAITDQHDYSLLINLINRGADIYHKNRYPDGKTPLDIVSEINDPEAKSIILQQYLHDAILLKDTGLLRDAIERGADIFAGTVQGSSFFKLASSWNFLNEVLESTLIRRGGIADHEQSDWSILHLHALMGNKNEFNEKAALGCDPDESAQIPIVALEAMLNVVSRTDSDAMIRLGHFYRNNPPDEKGVISLTAKQLLEIKSPQGVKRVTSMLFSVDRKRVLPDTPSPDKPPDNLKQSKNNTSS